VARPQAVKINFRGDLVTEDEMAGMREKKWCQNRKGNDLLENLNIDVTILLKWILNSVRMW